MPTAKGRLEVITSAADLSTKLGDDFVLWVGSAISGSGVSPPYLAMVADVVNGITRLLPSKLAGDIYLDQLYAGYARQLVEEDGAYKNLLSNTKFEDFLWRVLRACNRTALDDLLDKLYTCAKNEYGPNHTAVATLLSSGKCRACFTTNFDNAIELACQDLGLNFDLCIEPGKYPSRLPEKGEKPVLIKMHGSAPDRNCVAKSFDLLEAEGRQIHSCLRNLLAGQRVLVLGYSGGGDIDISPHLSNTNAVFFWAKHKYSDPKDKEPPPDWAGYFVLLNLQYPPSPEVPNLLLELAGINVNPTVVFKEHEAVDLILKAWIERTDLDPKALIRLLYRWRRAGPVLHLYHEELAYGHLASQCRQYGWGCIQRGAYQTAFDIFSRALKSGGLTDEDHLHLKLGQGFALWQMGKWEEARALLERLANQIATNFGAKVDSVNLQLGNILADICRNYLEVSRDLLRIQPQHTRVYASKQWKLNDVRRLLQRFIDTQRIVGPQNTLLTQLVNINIDWLLGEGGDVAEIKKLNEIAMNSQYPLVAWAVVSLLLQMSFIEGLIEWRKLGGSLREAGIIDIRRKNYESLLVVFCLPLVHLFGMVGYRVAKSVVGWYYGIRTRIEERRYKRQVEAWSRWQHDWITKGKVGTMTE